MSVLRAEVLQLYRTMLKAAAEFQSYNYRNYALRRIRDGFRANKHVQNQEEINNLIKKSNESLCIIRRQVIVGKLYESDKLVIEEDFSEIAKRKEEV